MSNAPGFDPAKPWDTVFRVAVSEPAFWDTEVRDSNPVPHEDLHSGPDSRRWHHC